MYEYLLHVKTIIDVPRARSYCIVYYLIYPSHHVSEVGAVINIVLQMRRPRHREIKSLAQDRSTRN